MNPTPSNSCDNYTPPQECIDALARFLYPIVLEMHKEKLKSQEANTFNQNRG